MSGGSYNRHRFPVPWLCCDSAQLFIFPFRLGPPQQQTVILVGHGSPANDSGSSAPQTLLADDVALSRVLVADALSHPKECRTSGLTRWQSSRSCATSRCCCNFQKIRR